MSGLREEFLRLLRTDEEFRYAVAGLLGLEEILRRLDKHAEIIAKHTEEIARLREDMNKGFARHDDEIAKLREDFNRETARIWEEIKALREDMNKGFARHDEEIRKLRREVREVRSYMEKVSLTLEEEAREVIGGKLRRMGFEVGLDRLVIREGKKVRIEVDVYGALDDMCVLGEATVRAGMGSVVRLDRKLSRLLKAHPEFARPRVIKVLYTLWITEEAVEEARRRGIWVLRAERELTPLLQGS